MHYSGEVLSANFLGLTQAGDESPYYKRAYLERVCFSKAVPLPSKERGSRFVVAQFIVVCVSPIFKTLHFCWCVVLCLPEYDVPTDGKES